MWIIHESGLQENSGKGFFSGNGLGGSVAESKENGTNESDVLMECIDDSTWSNLRLIKLDIEGAERDALKGGLKSIRQYRPVLAICAYHKQDDLLILGDFISNLDNYRIYLRHYMNATSETIMYGVPDELCN